MTSPLVTRRIGEWEAAGLIDATTAARLREAEAQAAGRAAEADDTGGHAEPAIGRQYGITAVELFIYLGAGFVLGAWYALVASTIPSGEDWAAWIGAAGLMAALALGLAGVAMSRRDARFRRAAGVSLLAALPNLGIGLFLLAGSLRPEEYWEAPANALVASLVTLAAAFAARRVLPALTTQLGLAVAAAAAGLYGMLWLDVTLFPRLMTEYEQAPLDASAAFVRVLLSLAWWWAVGLGMAVLLVVLDPQPRTTGRTRLGRIAVGTTVVLGTAWAVAMRHDWNAGAGLAGEPVLEPVLGAAILLAVSGVFLLLAMRRADVGYLWPGGLGVFISLTWLNAEYLAVESGLWLALLTEGVVLFGVALGVNRLGRRLRSVDKGVGPEAPSPAEGDPS